MNLSFKLSYLLNKIVVKGVVLPNYGESAIKLHSSKKHHGLLQSEACGRRTEVY